MDTHYDVIAIGSGPAGGAVAAGCKKKGMKVALIESRGFGGTCPLRGCNPKKVLVNAAEIAAGARGFRGKGITADPVLSWVELMTFKRSFVNGMADKIRAAYEKIGIDCFGAQAEFMDKTTVNAGEVDLTADHIFIGTGAVPVKLDIPGGRHIIDSEEFLDLEILPETLVFIGGGYISMEFAHIAAALDRKPTILEMAERPLLAFDEDLTDMLVHLSEKNGIRIHTETTVHSLAENLNHFIVKTGREGTDTFDADLVINGAGRIPDLAGLNLKAAGVETKNGAVVVDRFMRSVSNNKVFAAGDAADTPFPLTPTAALEANAVVQNITGENQTAVDYTGIPSVVFTHPPLAQVGITEAEAKADNRSFNTHFFDTDDWFTSKSAGLSHTGTKLLVSPKTDRVLGASILGYHAEEVINVFALAMRLGLTVEDLKKGIWTYPSAVYDIKHYLP